jgi:PleD family two-component response regulator
MDVNCLMGDEVYDFMQFSGTSVRSARFSVNSPQDELEARGAFITPDPRRMEAVPGAESLVVLVVEDDWFVSDMTATCLREAGYLVLEIATGDAAVALLRQGGHFDILVTDINLVRE